MASRRPSFIPFVVVLALLMIAGIGWAATGKPFPGQSVPVRSGDLADYRSVIVNLGLVPDDPRTTDTRAWVPMDAEWGGLASTFLTTDGRYRIAVWVGRGTAPDYEPETRFEMLGQWQTVRTGYAEGIATIWELSGRRHGGVAIWSPQLVDGDRQIAEEIVSLLRDADP